MVWAERSVLSASGAQPLAVRRSAPGASGFMCRLTHDRVFLCAEHPLHSELPQHVSWNACFILPTIVVNFLHHLPLGFKFLKIKDCVLITSGL